MRLNTILVLLLISIASFEVRAFTTPRSIQVKPSHYRHKLPSPSYRHLSSPSFLESSNDVHFDPKTTISLVGGQSILILIAGAIAYFLKIPNFGLGSNVLFDKAAAWNAFLFTLPLGVVALVLDRIEDRVPALKDVTKATQRSVLALLGGTFKPLLGLVVAFALGTAAGLGEELLFRGILQFELVERGMASVLAVGLSSIIFGLLHAVTPLYAILATIASIYFGGLFIAFQNLAVPILCHALYDIVALLVAHWQIAKLSDTERDEVANWQGPGK